MTVGVTSGSRNLLVDMLCDVCRVQGFTIERNIESQRGTANALDLVASRKQGDKSQTIAFGCWERDEPTDAKRIEAFLRALRRMKIGGGIYVSPRGFTPDAEFIARKEGLELWDLPKLKDQLHKIQAASRTEVPGTLPVSRTISSAIYSVQLQNARFLRMRAMPRLEFRPYYFARFSAGRDREARGRGVLVLDGVDGRVCDAGMLEGRLNGLPSTGFFVDCLQVEPMVGELSNLPDELGLSGSVTVAPAGILQENVRGLVHAVLVREAGLDSGGLTVTDVDLLHVPIVTVELGAGRKTYRKIVQAATSKMIWDETAQCVFCRNLSRAVCEVCGGTACQEHGRVCSSCLKNLCAECATVKGVLSKKPFCPTCGKA